MYQSYKLLSYNFDHTKVTNKRDVIAYVTLPANRENTSDRELMAMVRAMFGYTDQLIYAIIAGKEYNEIEYITIDLGCNGTFILVDSKWHMLHEITGTCYNFGNEILPENSKQLVIDNNNDVYNRLIISRKIFDLDWIITIPFNDICMDYKLNL